MGDGVGQRAEMPPGAAAWVPITLTEGQAT
jgi:hypothetical protein